MNRIATPGTVDPNQEATYTWTVTAPAAAGTYNFQWQMRQSGVEWFGALSTNVAVTVGTTPPPPPPPPPASDNNAQFLLQTVPASMVAGQTYSVTVKMKNTGTTTWTIAETYHLRSQNPPKNFTWGPDRADLGAAESIAPNQEKVFTWDVTAPATAGTYNFQWQMRRSSTDEWFGDLTPNVAVTVSTTPPPPPPPPPAGTNLAQFVSQTAPSALTTGETFTASVTMKNVGTTSWTEAAQYRLSSRGPRDNTTWSINRVYLAPTDSIAPGQTHTFTFDVIAPATAGSTVFQWSMVQDGVDWFNDVTPSVSVTVSASAPPPAPTVPPIASTTTGSKNKGAQAKCFGAVQAGGMDPKTLALIAAVSLLLSVRRRRC